MLYKIIIYIYDMEKVDREIFYRTTKLILINLESKLYRSKFTCRRSSKNGWFENDFIACVTPSFQVL